MKIQHEQDLSAVIQNYTTGSKEQWHKIISPLAPTGLYLLLKTTRGVVTTQYVYRYRSLMGQYQRKLRLGSTHDLTFPEALSEHHSLFKQVANDGDPAGDRRKEKALALATAGNAKTFAQLAAQFMELKEKNGARPSTLKNHNCVLKKWLLPRIGKLSLKDITARDVKTAKDAAGKSGMGSQELQTLQLTKQILDYGCNQLLIEYNVASALKADFRKKTRTYAWSDAQIKTLIEAIVTTEKPNAMAREARIAFWLLLVTGARRLEILHLRKEEVAFTEAGGALLTISEDRVKTKKFHHISLSPYSAGLVKEAIELSGESEYVFPSPFNGKKPRQGSSFTKTVTTIMQAENVPGVVHTARHTFISLGVRMGLDPSTVDSLTGHAQLTGVGQKYLHMKGLTKPQIEAAAAIEDYIVALKDGAEPISDQSKVIQLMQRTA